MSRASHNSKVRVEYSILTFISHRIPELNLLAITLIEYDHQNHVAMAHIDPHRRIQLLSRELTKVRGDISISSMPSELLPTSALLQNAVAILDSPRPLQLISVPRFQVEFMDHQIDTEGGVIVLGARTIFYFELASIEGVRGKKDKRRRLENRKSSGDENVREKAKEKEKERESRKVRPKASVKWPWDEVSA